MKKVEIYTVDYCPYCKRALEFLREHNIEFKQVDITAEEDEMRQKLGEIYNIPEPVTVPQIVVNNVRIGGYDDLVKTDLEKLQ